MDDLLSLLNDVYKAVKASYLEDSIIVQTVTEMFRVVDVIAFNDLLMRRNFLSWKRGLQINCNITRIEEWCKSHDMPEGTQQLEHHDLCVHFLSLLSSCFFEERRFSDNEVLSNILLLNDRKRRLVHLLN
jgi:myosin heavy subunit